MSCNESTEPFNHFSQQRRMIFQREIGIIRKQIRNQGDGGDFRPRVRRTARRHCTSRQRHASPCVACASFSRDLHSPAAAQRRPKCVAGLLRGSRITRRNAQDASGLFPRFSKSVTCENHVNTMGKQWENPISAKTSTSQNPGSPVLPSSGVSKSLGEPCSTNFPASRTTTSEGS